jgi:hypothetical protein
MPKDEEVWPIRFPAELVDRVRAAAKERADRSRMNVTVSGMIRYLVERGLTEFERKRVGAGATKVK